MSDEIFDDAWPVATSRDEMYQRVTARGARLRATRRALSSLLMVGSLLGAGAIGAGAISTLNGGPTERGDVPELAGPPDLGRPDTGPSAPADPVTGSTSAPRTTAPGTTAPRTTAPPTTGADPSTTVVSPPTTASTEPSTTATTAPSTTATTTPSTTATTTPVAEGADLPPAVGVLQVSGDRPVSTGSSGCAGAETAATVSVWISNATEVVMIWDDGSGPVTVPMTSDGPVWSGPIGPIVPPTDGQQQIPVTVKAVGPGGVGEVTESITVEACAAP